MAKKVLQNKTDKRKERAAGGRKIDSVPNTRKKVNFTNRQLKHARSLRLIRLKKQL